MQVNVYNSLDFPVTIGNITIEVGHNYIPIEIWSSYSDSPEVAEFVENGSFLINCYQAYSVFENSVDEIKFIDFDNVQSLEKLEYFKKKYDANIILCDIYKEQFKNTHAGKEFSKLNLKAIEKAYNDKAKELKAQA